MPSSETLFPWLIHSALVSLVVLTIGAAAALAAVSRSGGCGSSK